MAREYFKNLPDKTTPLSASRINGLLNGKESMGSIVVEDIQCKNLYNPDNARTSGGSLQNCDNTIYLQPNTNYVFKSNHTWTQVRLYNSSGVETRSIGGDREDITEISFTTTSDEVKGLFIFYVGDYFNINELDFTGIQLEKGTVATDFVPHKEFSYNATNGVTDGIYWIKYEDGTLIQRGNYSINGLPPTSGIMTKINLPIAFIDNLYAVTITKTSGGSSLFSQVVDACYRTNYYIEFNSWNNDINDTTDPISYTWFAIGRWK